MRDPLLDVEPSPEAPHAGVQDDPGFAAGSSTEGAVAVLRRGLAATPELRRGLAGTVVLALLGATGRVAIPVVAQQAIDRGIDGDEVDIPLVAVIAVAGVAIIVVTTLLIRAAMVRLAMTAESALYGLRTRAFDHVHRLSLAHHTEERRGALVARVTSDVETLSLFFAWGGVAWIVNIAVMTAVATAMFVYDWRLALVALGSVVPLFFVLRAVQRRVLRAWDEVRLRVADVLATIGETVTGAGVIRAYGVQTRAARRAEATVDAHRRAYTRANTLSALLFPSGEVTTVFTIAAVVLTALAVGPEGGLTSGEVVAFMFLVSLFLAPIAEFTEILDQTQTAVAGWRRVLDVLDTPVDVPWPPPARAVELPDEPPELSVHHLRFRYGDGPLVLDGIDVTFPACSTTAIVGATGSGKSTLARLLVRLADPTEGLVRVGGVDLRDVDSVSLRRRLVLVPQETFLFDASIEDNVRFGRPGASTVEVRRAFEHLALEDWLDGLPEGPATRAGERGELLSVGERQLVALARAALVEPVCLLLDEATASVDSGTETRITRALEVLTEERTAIVIAHRLSTAERADRIVVLDHGRLVEVGDHASLLDLGGVYAALHRSWLDASMEPVA